MSLTSNLLKAFVREVAPIITALLVKPVYIRSVFTINPVVLVVPFTSNLYPASVVVPISKLPLEVNLIL